MVAMTMPVITPCCIWVSLLGLKLGLTKFMFSNETDWRRSGW